MFTPRPAYPPTPRDAARAGAQPRSQAGLRGRTAPHGSGEVRRYLSVSPAPMHLPLACTALSPVAPAHGAPSSERIGCPGGVPVPRAPVIVAGCLIPYGRAAHAHHRALGTNLAHCGGCSGSGVCESEHSGTTGAPSIGASDIRSPAVSRHHTPRGLDGKWRRAADARRSAESVAIPTVPASCLPSAFPSRLPDAAARPRRSGPPSHAGRVHGARDRALT